MPESGAPLVAVDFASLDETEHAAACRRLCDALESVDAERRYGEVTVTRPSSKHNPVLRGEFGRAAVVRWFLEREFRKLARAGAAISVAASRKALDLHDPALFARVDEGHADGRRKKLFLFGPERAVLSMNRLEHYTGTPAETFQRYVLFTNYAMHVEAFLERFPDAVAPSRPGVQMPAYHAPRDGNGGITLVNIGVGPSNAKTITDHVAVLRPDAMLMVGHCGGLRNHQEIGDLVLAQSYMRDDRVLDDVLPRSVPVTSTFALNELLVTAIEARGLPYRMGTVYTTANRNWEFFQAGTLDGIRHSRSLAIDMESGTIAANGFRYRIPNATLLCVSDKPLHGRPKISDAAQAFYQMTRTWHVAIAVEVLDAVRARWPEGIPTADIRSLDEPLFGSI